MGKVIGLAELRRQQEIRAISFLNNIAENCENLGKALIEQIQKFTIQFKNKIKTLFGITALKILNSMLYNI